MHGNYYNKFAIVFLFASFASIHAVSLTAKMKMLGISWLAIAQASQLVPGGFVATEKWDALQWSWSTEIKAWG
ncbi:hypothetical protein GCM10011369_07810 [Neiella marina]|uniref:Uncharacterized protein n=1 Tax=Neiella marina TaxID=508461 RepID=A0A8J2XN26_9GAMM|nr:hypothetical protein GCM10011369_07810 [Neiella marina]